MASVEENWHTSGDSDIVIYRSVDVNAMGGQAEVREEKLQFVHG